MTDNNELAEALAEISVLRRRWSDSESKLAACDSDLRTILAERDALRVDAARYRWAKENRWPRACPTGYYLSDGAIYPSEDAAIDAAMAAEGRE